MQGIYPRAGQLEASLAKSHLMDRAFSARVSERRLESARLAYASLDLSGLTLFGR